MPRRHWRSSLAGRALALALGLAVPTAGWPVLASAQTAAELDHARQLYSQGLTQEAAGDWAGALATFQQVSRIKLTPQVRFHIARCKENLGRLNEALGGYRMAQYEAEQAGDKGQDILGEIKAARDALEKRIPKLVIERGEGADTIKIELDGVALGQTEIGREVRIDPGPHVIAGVLPSGERFTKKIYAKENDTKQVILDVPPDLQPKSSGHAPIPVEHTAATAVDDSTADEGSKAPPHRASALPWIIGGAGVVSLAAAGVFYLRMKSAQKELDDGCIGTKCPDTLQSAQDRGKLDATLVDVTLGVGVVGIGVATVLLIQGGSSDNAATEARQKHFAVDVAAAPHSMGVNIAGRF